MEASDEAEAWNEQDFEDGYLQFDNDGSGQIEKSELLEFIKRFADLWRLKCRHARWNRHESVYAFAKGLEGPEFWSVFEGIQLSYL